MPQFSITQLYEDHRDTLQLNWIAARGAMGDGVHEISRNYHIPISNTAAATMLLQTDAVRLLAQA